MYDSDEIKIPETLDEPESSLPRIFRQLRNKRNGALVGANQRNRNN